MSVRGRHGDAADGEYPRGMIPAYDWIVYGEAEAEAEAEVLELIEHAFAGLARRPVRDVLDAGCGTGRGLLALAREGYRMVGLDLSRPMLGECRRRLRARGLKARLVAGDLVEFEMPGRFDAVIALDSVLLYVGWPEGIDQALRRLWECLRPGGVLVAEHRNLRQAVRDAGACVRGEEGDGGFRVRYEARPRIVQRHEFHLDLRASVWQGEGWVEHEVKERLRVAGVREMLWRLRRAGFSRAWAYADGDWTHPVRSAGDAQTIGFVALRAE